MILPASIMRGRVARFAIVAHVVGFLLLRLASCGAVEIAKAPMVRFNADVRPILSSKCFACHGLDAKHRQADLRLDTAAGASEDHGNGAAVVPGDLDSSEMWRRITSDDEDERMPPPDARQQLTDADRDVLRRWIEQGAAYEKHWSFEPPRAEVPAELNTAIDHPIDRFIVAKIQQQDLTPSSGLPALAPPADRPTQIRRVAFTLTGLPPTPDEVEHYLNDIMPGAYERMVDRYLESPRYGEEMARHWLDVARYADTHGMHLDNERQTWAYRDWVVSAFNRNLPFDQFTVDQLAGDLISDATREQLVATGFNRCNVTSSEGGSIDAELLYRYAVDRTSTMVEAWMGLTGGCAVCHDHKFDPISQREFYSMYAFFNSAADPAMDGNALLTQPILKLESDETKTRLAQLSEEIAAQHAALNQLTSEVNYQDPAVAETTPPPASVEIVLMDEEFPSDGKLTTNTPSPANLVSRADSDVVWRGERSLHRTDTGLAQDVWDQAATARTIPSQAKLFAHVWLDPANPPRAIMLQYHRDGWMHRAVWGDYDAIPWGAANTTERVHQGVLPPVGEWTALEVPADQLGLHAGDAITGFALTQFGGHVAWDYVGIRGISDPATDPVRSFAAWRRQIAGRDTPGLPSDLTELAKRGPQADEDGDSVRRLLHHFLQRVCVDTKPRFEGPLAAIAKLQAEQTSLTASIPGTFIYRDLEQPRPSFVMMRGAYDKPSDPVEPGVPAVLPPLVGTGPDGRATRLDLARWLVAPEHPLTARVTVNRFWQQVFGTGLVKTSYDFGSQGEVPSHPELLDWLAVNFQQSGWDIKRLMRLMLTSDTFRQDSRVSDTLLTRDPANRWYARGPRFRLDAEQIRDNALFVSGLINLQVGGKGVKTYQPENIWEPVGFAGSNTRFYQQDHGSALYRRSLYTFMKRTAPAPFLSNFDAPNREQFCTRRERSNTPLQALQLMNDVQHVEAARELAARMLREGGDTPEARIAWAYRLILSRNPDVDELQVITQQLAAHAKRYEADSDAAQQLIGQGESKPDAALSAPTLASYTLVANTLLNLDETLTRN